MATPDEILVTDPGHIRAILETTRTIAVIGLSPSPLRESHEVAAYMQRQGYRIVPINPHASEVLGEQAYPSLDEVPRSIEIDMVDVFRRSEVVAPHIDEVMRRSGVRCLWLQDGVIDWAGAKRAHAAGIAVVMDDCVLRRHRQLMSG
jgi:predicted CoA-binding protein